MHLVHGPEIDLLIGGQRVEFFCALPVSEGLHARLPDEGFGSETPQLAQQAPALPRTKLHAVLFRRYTDIVFPSQSLPDNPTSLGLLRTTPYTIRQYAPSPPR